MLKEHKNPLLKTIEEVGLDQSLPLAKPDPVAAGAGQSPFTEREKAQVRAGIVAFERNVTEQEAYRAI